MEDVGASAGHAAPVPVLAVLGASVEAGANPS